MSSVVCVRPAEVPSRSSIVHFVNCLLYFLSSLVKSSTSISLESADSGWTIRVGGRSELTSSAKLTLTTTPSLSRLPPSYPSVAAMDQVSLLFHQSISLESLALIGSCAVSLCVQDSFRQFIVAPRFAASSSSAPNSSAAGVLGGATPRRGYQPPPKKDVL